MIDVRSRWLERRPEQGPDVGEEFVECCVGERISVQQTGNQWRVAEVRQECSVARQQKLLRVMATKPTGIHLASKILRRPGEERLERNTEFHVTELPAGERLASDQPNEVGVGPEEFEARCQHVVELLPTGCDGVGDGRLDPLVPFGQRPLEDLSVHRFLCREVVEQTLAANADLGRDEVERCALEASFGEEMLCRDDDRISRSGATHDGKP